MSGLHLATALVGLAAIALGVVGAAALIAIRSRPGSHA